MTNQINRKTERFLKPFRSVNANKCGDFSTDPDSHRDGIEVTKRAEYKERALTTHRVVITNNETAK